MMPFFDLPKPSPAALLRSEKLSLLIQEALQLGKTTLSFADFMEMALYTPALGYYQSLDFTLGEKGDFITAPHLTPLFAHCIGKQAMQIFAASEANFLELGPGTGQFAADLISYLTKNCSLPKKYYFYEKSAALKLKQQHFLKTACPAYFANFRWLDELPHDFSGMIFANEVLDALPVTRFRLCGASVEEVNVAWDTQKKFSWQCAPAREELRALVATYKKDYFLADNYTTEINLQLAPFVTQLSACLRAGALLIADYGYGRAEYYHPQRNAGTLTCFYRHHKHSNPLILPGLQDITAHVDFTRVAESATLAGARVAGFTTQAGFLLACGLLDSAAEMAQQLTLKEQYQLSQALKQLTMPLAMGEVIKMLAVTKNIAPPLLGFGLQDRRRDL